MNNLQQLKSGLELNTKKALKYVETLEGDEIFFRPYDKVNHNAWHLGHITFVRNTIIRLLDPTQKLEMYAEEKGLFAPGTPLLENFAFPNIAVIKDAFQKRGDKITELINSVSEEHLNTESWFKLPFLPNATNQDFVFFFYNHETEHLGEMKVTRNIATRIR
jgi:uncharacterized damage-inducible protein DinB